MNKLLKAVAVMGLAAWSALSFADNSVILGKTSAGVVKEVQVNSSGQVVVAPLSFENQTDGIAEVKLGPFEPEEVAASATDQTLGATGGVGDYLDHCVCQVLTSGATGTCGIEDGTNTAYDNITVVGASAPLGMYEFNVHMLATTSAGWEATTGAGATMQCYGLFTD